VTARWIAGHEHLDDLAAALSGLGREVDRLGEWGRRLGAVLVGGGRLLVAGNGGSAAEAQHLTAELVGRYDGERRPLSAIALHAETSTVTAVANDYGYDEAFARQVLAHGRPGDVFLGISTSGSSANVVRACRAAREARLTTWALTGRGPNALAAASDDAVCVVGRTVAAVQEVHLLACHLLCQAVDEVVAAVDRRSATVGGRR
jgi:D-sedoheptulose 7-phosphate isomerase